jgi:hypothetical protein
MPLVECIAGYTETNVSGSTYTFNRDAHNRFVAIVENPAHLHCLLSVVHYRVVSDEPEVKADAPAPVEAKPSRKRAAKTATVDPASSAPADGADQDGPADADAPAQVEAADATVDPASVDAGTASE